MPSSQDLASSSKRPGLSSRHSPSSAQTLRSPLNDTLSSSAQARRPAQRHVASSRLGPRAPSFNRNLNKLSKATAANLAEDSSSPRPGNVKRNSSITHLTRDNSSSALKKTYSETSLVRNKSATNLTKNKSSTHLPRVASSRHVAKGSRAQFVRSRRSVSQATTAQRDTGKNGVRFDLDSEQAEVDGDVAEARRAELSDEDYNEDDDDEQDEYEEDHAPLTPAEEARVNQVPEEDETSPPKHPPPAAAAATANGKRSSRDTMVQFRFPQPQSQMYAQPAKAAASPSPTFALKVSNEGGDDAAARQQSSATPLQDRSNVTAEESQANGPTGRDTDADSITSKLLKRNQSSGRVASQPIMSDAEAIFKGVAHPERLSPKPIELSTPNASGQDLVSRFISISGGSSTNTPRNSHSLTKATPDDGWTEVARRNQSLTDMQSSQLQQQQQQHQHQRSESLRSGVLTPSQQPPSRTQQKLWLERDLSNIESQQGRQTAFLRPNRSFALGLGAGLYPGNSEVRLSQPQQRQFHDQSSIEYRRIRLFQHPLAQGVTRLQNAGVTPRTKAPSRASSTKSGLFGGGSASNEKPNGLSQSWNSRKSAATAASVPRPVESQMRRKVTFQGLKSPEDGSPRKSLDDEEESQQRSEKDEARDVCRRMWELPAYVSGD